MDQKKSMYCALSDFHSIIFVKFVAESTQERAEPKMFISKTFSFMDNTTGPTTFKLLRGLFQQSKQLKAEASYLSVSYFDHPDEITPDDGSEHIFVFGHVTSTENAHIYAGYLFSQYCSVAIKLSNPGQNILHEYLILKHLGTHICGVQKLKLYTTLGGRATLVTAPLGVALSKLSLTHKFSTLEATNIVFNLLPILRKVHAKGIIHRDIKPSNVIVHNETLHLIDFGVACLAADTEYSWAGTMLYSALPAMLCFPPDPYHDYESLIYLAIFLLKQKLPWSYMSKPEEIIKEKQYYRENLELLCDGFPPEFTQFVSCVFKRHHTRQIEHKIYSCKPKLEGVPPEALNFSAQ